MSLDPSDAESVQLPKGWVLAPLAELVTVLNGRAYNQNELLSAGTPVLRVGNLFTSDRWYYSTLQLEEEKYCEKGDLIFAWSASFGPFIWSGEKVIYHYHIWKLSLHGEADLNKLYLYNFLLQKTREIKRGWARRFDDPHDEGEDGTHSSPHPTSCRTAAHRIQGR